MSADLAQLLRLRHRANPLMWLRWGQRSPMRKTCWLGVMKTFPVLLATMLTSGALAQAVGFSHVTLLRGGDELVIYRSDGHSSAAAKLQDQSAFDKPAISSNRHYLGWLALYSGQGTSYALPLELVVEDDRDHIYHFAGSFGMVFGWCFATGPNSVTFMYSFPHGLTPVAFETRRIRDGKILQHFELDPSQMDKVVGDAAPRSLPQWARCAWANAQAQ